MNMSMPVDVAVRDVKLFADVVRQTAPVRDVNHAAYGIRLATDLLGQPVGRNRCIGVGEAGLALGSGNGRCPDGRA